MHKTRLFRNGNSQAIRIPAELAYPDAAADLEIEREGDELRIRPARRSLANALRILPRASAEYMSQGREENAQSDRELL